MTTVQLGAIAPRATQLATSRLRMTARGRRVLVALVVAPVLVLIAALALNSGSATASNESVALTYVSVQQGESLWQLAEQVAPTADPRDVIDEIESLNHLDSSQIVAGQRLAIPAEYLSGSAPKNTTASTND